MDREEVQKKKKPKFNAPSAFNVTSPRPYIASAAAPTSAEIQDVDAVIISKEGCAQTMVQAIEAVQARKAAGLAAGNLNYKSPPTRQDMVAETMASIRAHDKRDDGMMSDVRSSMAFERLELAEKRLERAELKNDQDEIELAKKSLKRIRDEIDAEKVRCCARRGARRGAGHCAAGRSARIYNAKNSSIVMVGQPEASEN
jgi:hypothetical protein